MRIGALLGDKEQVLIVSAATFVWLMFLICAAESLSTPPYWDSLTAIFREALWLLDHKFNYYDLAFKEPGYIAGGARTYFFSWYPAFLALLYKYIDNPELIFVLLRLLNLLFYLCIALVISISAKNLNFPYQLRILSVLTFLIHPLILSQTFALNMELGITAFCLLGLVFYQSGDYKLAVLFNLIALGMKQSAIVYCAGILFFDVLRLLKNRPSIKSLKNTSLLLIPLLIYFLCNHLDSSFFLEHGRDGKIISLKSIVSNPEILIINIGKLNAVPEILLLIIFIGFLGFYNIVKYCLKFRQPKVLQERFNDGKEFLFCYQILIFFWMLSFMTLTISLPRYTTAVLPLLILSLYSIFLNLNLWKFLYAIPLLLLLNINAGVYKFFGYYEAMNEGFILETSMQYTEAVKFDREVSKFLQYLPKNIGINVSIPLYFALQDSRLGYESLENQLGRIGLGKTQRTCEINDNEPEKCIDFYQDNIFARYSPKAGDRYIIFRAKNANLSPYFLVGLNESQFKRILPEETYKELQTFTSEFPL